jgi:GST-like protein
MAKPDPRVFARDRLLDEALADTFPASDPIALNTTTPPLRKSSMPKAVKKSAAKKYKLYGTQGCGSMLIEAAFGIAKVPFDYVEVPWADTGWNSKALKKLNPLGQVPTLVLPDGTVMTESAAILLHIKDTVPDFELVPDADDPNRPAFLRFLFFLIAAVYPTFTYGDITERWVGEKQTDGVGKLLRASTNEHRQHLHRFLNAQVKGPYFLGKQRSAIDLYLWAMTKWRPGPDWFKAECPKLYKIGALMDADPALKKVAERNDLATLVQYYKKKPKKAA